VRKLTANMEPHWSDIAASATDGSDCRRCADARRVRHSAGSCCTDIEQTHDGRTRYPAVPPEVVGADAVSGVVQWWEAGRTGDYQVASPSTCLSRR